MKKILLVVTAIFLSTSAFAQHFEYGIKGGLNLAWDRTCFMDDGVSPRLGIHVGALTEYVINNNVGIQAELLYSMQGMRAKSRTIWGESLGETYTEKLDYINLPILVKFYTTGRSSLELGPQFGYLVSAKAELSDGMYSETINVYNEKGLKKFDFSLCLGISHKFESGVDISLRSVYGLTKAVKDSDAKHLVLQLGMGYRF